MPSPVWIISQSISQGNDNMHELELKPCSPCGWLRSVKVKDQPPAFSRKNTTIWIPLKNELTKNIHSYSI